MGVTQTATGFLFSRADLISLIPGWEFVLVMINFLIFVFIMKKKFFGPIQKIMAERKQIVESGLEEARLKEEQALDLKQQYEDKLSKADDEASEILRDKINISKQKANEIIENANLEATKIKDRAQKDIEREKVKAKNQLKNEIGDLVFDTAEKYIGSNMDSKSNDEIIDKAIEKMGDLKWSQE